MAYDPLGLLLSIGADTYTFSATTATNYFEHRPAYDAGERKLKVDPFGRVTEARRASDDSLLGSYRYDCLGRPVDAFEEEFTGNTELHRFRVFDGCQLVTDSRRTRAGLKAMGSSAKKLFGGATGKIAQEAIETGTGARLEVAKDLVEGAIGDFVAPAVDAVRDAAVGQSELGLSTPGAIGYDMATALNGGQGLMEALDRFAELCCIGLESLAKLKESLEGSRKAIADRRLFKEQLRGNVAGNCAVAKKALDEIAAVWPDADIGDLKERLDDVKADLAAQGVR